VALEAYSPALSCPQREETQESISNGKPEVVTALLRKRKSVVKVL